MVVPESVILADRVGPQRLIHLTRSPPHPHFPLPPGNEIVAARRTLAFYILCMDIDGDVHTQGPVIRHAAHCFGISLSRPLPNLARPSRIHGNKCIVSASHCSPDILSHLIPFIMRVTRNLASEQSTSRHTTSIYTMISVCSSPPPALVGIHVYNSL